MANFFQGILAATSDFRLFFMSLLANKLFLGFASGVLFSVLLTGFVISRDPRRIPLILRYSSDESFQKIAPRDANGMFTLAFTNFLKIYTQIRTLFFVAFIAFCVMVTTMLLTYRP